MTLRDAGELTPDADADAASHERLMALFDDLCDAPPAQRADRLVSLRQRDATLADQLARMLEADLAGDDPLDETGGAAGLAVGFAGVLAGDRWRLRDRLGRGGGGEVWRAEDTAGGPDVAVKLIDPALMDSPRQIRRFRREFRALSRLDHEGCLRVLAEGALEQLLSLTPAPRRFIVMEYVGGGDLTRLSRARDDVLLPVLLQLASALDYIHRHQIVHRDLKPANVLLTAEDPPRVKLADFGVIKLSERHGSQITDGGGLIGTLDYLSPEQVRGEDVDPRSDLYALGCLIHALWAGDVPFGGNRMERLWGRVNQPAPPLASRAPAAPPGLCALTDELLRREPDQRPQSANEVVQRVYALLPTLPEASWRAGDFPLPPVGHGAFLFPPGLVGRDATMAALLAEADAARATSAPRLVAVVGAAGLGKTTVAAALSRRLADDGWRTVRVESSDDLGQAPFAPFPALEARLAALAVSPSRAPPPPSPPEPAVRPDQDVLRAQRRLAAAIAAALAALPAGRPTCVLLEDLHDASPGADGVLAALLPALAARGTPALLLATGRPHGRDRLAASPSVRLLELEPLDDASSVRVIARILGASTSELPDALTRPLVEESGGNPLLLRTAVRNLAEAGGLRRTGDTWSVRPGTSARDAVTSLLERRLAALGPSTSRVASVAAVIGNRFDADVLAAAAGVGEDALLDALADGVRAAVFAPDTNPGRGADTYRFDHARLAELLLSRLDAPDRAALHDAVGEALLARGAPVAALAHHLGQGTDPRRALDHLGAAVEQARDAHDQDTVARQLAQMLARLEELDEPDVDATRRALTEQRADALVTVGGYTEAAELLQGLEAEAPSDVDRGRLLRKRGLALMRTADPGRGLSALEGALTLLGDRTPRTRAGRLARLSWDFLATVLGRVLPARAHSVVRDERARAHGELTLMYRWVDLYDSVAHLGRFYRLAGRRAPTEYQVDANAMAALLFALRSMPRAGARVQERARELAQSTGDLVGLTRLTIIQGGCEAMLKDATTALDRMEQAVELARQTGDRWLVCFAMSQRAWVRGLVGSVPQAYAEFAEAEALARDIGAVWLEADAMSGGMLSALVIGKIAEGERAAKTLLTSDVRLSFPVFEQLAVEGMAGVAFVTGRFDAALVGFERAYDLLRRHRLDEGWGWLVPMEIVEAGCCLADQAGVAVVPRLVRRLKRAQGAIRRMSRLPLYQGCADVGRGVVASRRGRKEAALRHFAEGVAARGTTRRSYMDTWIMVRPALERLHLGAPRDEVAVELDAVEAEYEHLGLIGLQGWLRIMRGVHGV